MSTDLRKYTFAQRGVGYLILPGTGGRMVIDPLSNIKGCESFLLEEGDAI